MADRYRNVPQDPYESYPGSIYTEFSPKDKRRHIRDIGKELMESGFDWTNQDAILRNERQKREGLNLFEKSGAFFEGDKVNLSNVDTKEKKEMYERANSTLDNLAAKEGINEYEWSELENEDPSWSNFGEAVVGTGKDIGSDLYNMMRWGATYPLYGIPGINADVEGFLDKYMPYIEGPEQLDISPESAYKNWKFYNEFKDNISSDDQEGGFRYSTEPSVDEDSWLNFLNQEGGGFLGKSSVSELNPWKGFANRFRTTGDIGAIAAMLYATRGKGIAPLVNKLPNAMKSKIGQVLPWSSGQGSFWPKYTGSTKALGEGLANTGKNIWRHMTKRKWNPFTTQPSTYRNVAWSLPTLGATSAAKDVWGQDVSIADTFDRDKALFDNYMTNKLQNFKPRPTPRHPREMMEQSYGQSLHGEIDEEYKPRIGIGFGDGPTYWGGGDIE